MLWTAHGREFALFDSRNCQTLNASPAKPGGLPLGLGDLAPLLISTIGVAPQIVFHETIPIARDLSHELGMSSTVYVSNLRMVIGHFLRHEFLAGAIVCRTARIVVEARLQRRGCNPELETSAKVARLLGIFVAGYIAIGCGNPLIYERYFVVLSPVVTLLFLLDAFALAREAPRLATPGRERWVIIATGAMLLGLGVATLAVRIETIHGRLLEIARPNHGPLDLVVPYLQERYPDPTSLVIATNYEEHPLMYYLGSHVIVGGGQHKILEDRRQRPDVVIPRRWWRPGLSELRRFLAAAEFERVAFPIPDAPYNTNPSLSQTPWIPQTHRFSTPELRDSRDRLVLYQRVDADEASGASP